MTQEDDAGFCIVGEPNRGIYTDDGSSKRSPAAYLEIETTVMNEGIYRSIEIGE